MERRAILLKWIPPVVAVVALPVHAMTSICSKANIAGVWLYEGTNYGITLYENGASDAGLGGGIWSVDGLEIRITYDGVDHLIVGKLLQNCTRIEGIDFNQCCYPTPNPSQIEVVLVKST